METVNMTFRALDISGSGSIKCTHFKYLITNIGNKLSDREAEEMLADIDRNKDGKISYSEFRVGSCIKVTKMSLHAYKRQIILMF